MTRKSQSPILLFTKKNDHQSRDLGWVFEHNFGLGGQKFKRTTFQLFKCPVGKAGGCWNFKLIDAYKLKSMSRKVWFDGFSPWCTVIHQAIAIQLSSYFCAWTSWLTISLVTWHNFWRRSFDSEQQAYPDLTLRAVSMFEGQLCDSVQASFVTAQEADKKRKKKGKSAK